MQWTTVERGRPAARWGPRPGEYSDVALASLDTYTRGDMCGGASGSLHVHIVLMSYRAQRHVFICMQTLCIRCSKASLK